MKRYMLNADDETQAYIKQIKKNLEKKGLTPSDSQVIAYALNIAFYKLLNDKEINYD